MQWALLTPLVILTVVGIIQAGIILHARNGAQSAAMAGAEAQGLSGSASSAGVEVATRLAQAADLEKVDVTVVKTSTAVSVVVSGRAPVFLDFGQGRITARASAPLEGP